MKTLSLLLLLPAVQAMAAVTAVATPGTYELYQGDAMLSSHATYEACEGAAKALAVTGSYTCRASTRVEVTVSADTAMPMSVHETGMGPTINAALIPPRGAGYPGARLKPTGEQPVATDVGAFRTTCGFSHMSYDDPIVFPGQPGRSHLHVFFGNTGVNAGSTAESLRTTGDSTCRGGTFNRSGYWVPALIDTKDGRPLTPAQANVYYKTGYLGVRPQDVRPMPAGLRMVAGDVTNQDPNRGERWNCVSPDRNPPWKVGIATDCPVGSQLVQSVLFPQCWNGRDLDSPDHKSHMAYARGGCPATHPVALPEVGILVGYDIKEAGQAARLRLASDMYDASKPGGLSSHGDWFNGWAPGASEAWTSGCLNRAMDCHSHLTGAGQEMY